MDENSNNENIKNTNANGDTKTGAITAIDYLEKQSELEKTAAEVLPGKFDKCTFTKGYLHQPVYACLTCISNNGGDENSKGENLCDDGSGEPTTNQKKQPAGICYSCSISCHSDHNVIELFAKRNFRCDCGVKVLKVKNDDGQNKGGCQLMDREKIKSSNGATNEDNKYNHNFLGRYCRCDTFYNPESEEGEMIQCFMCQDWFHDRCIGKMPKEESFDSYICRECITKHEKLLRHLPDTSVYYGRVNPQTGKVDSIVDLSIKQDTPASVNVDIVSPDREYENNGDSAKRKVEQSDDSASQVGKKSRTEAQHQDQEGEEEEDKFDKSQLKDIFTKDGWETQLCQCPNCTGYIKAHSLEFLTKDDPVIEPEVDPEREESLYTTGMRDLAQYDYSTASKGALALRALGDDLKSFLRPFASEGKIVTSEDIVSFFAQRKHGTSGQQ